MNLFRKAILFFLGTIFVSVSFAKEKVIFWHSMSGSLQQTLNKIVEGYNNSQENFEIEPIFQGSYEETISKFKAISNSKEAPAIIQMNDVSTAFMYRSGAIIPMQEFIEKENFDIKNLEPALLNYYKINGNLYSMPFNSSTAILLYNKDAFREVGLDPEKPPVSYKEFVEYSQKLTTKQSNGTIDRYGFAMVMYGWFIEQLLANQNSLYVNEDNGRIGKFPTGVAYTKTLPTIFSWLKEMYSKKIATSYGRDWNSTRAAFNSGKVAMILDSSAGLKNNIENSNFEVGTGFIPNESGNFYGSTIGGASLWITKTTNEKIKNGAWDFIKYAVSKDVQAYWASNTGYYPVNIESYNTPILQNTFKEIPQFKVVVDELHSSTQSYTTQGAVLGTFPEVREKMVEAMESIYEGKDVISTVGSVSSSSNRIIERFNRINK